MSYFNRDGVWFTVDGDISDVEDLIHKARIDLTAMKDRHPDLQVLEFERPGEYKIRSVHGKDEVFISREYVEKKGKLKFEIERDVSSLVIAYEVGTWNGILTGFYVTIVFPAPHTREEGDWPEGFWWYDSDPNLPRQYCWDNAVRWGQLVEPVYLISDAYPEEKRWELQPLPQVATDKTGEVSDDYEDDDTYDSTGWVPGLYSGPSPTTIIAGGVELQGPNLSGTYWLWDEYWMPECIIDVQDGILRHNTLWEFCWPKSDCGTHNVVTNLAAVPNYQLYGYTFFGMVKGRSGWYMSTHDSATFCLTDDQWFVTECWPCPIVWVWPPDGIQESWYSDIGTTTTTIAFDAGPTLWEPQLIDSKQTYKWWQGVYANISYRDYSRDDVGDFPWYYEPWCPACATLGEESYGDYAVWGAFVINYNYDFHCEYTVSPHDGPTDPVCLPSPMPFTWQLVFISSHHAPIVCYEQYLESWDEPEAMGIQCDIWDYHGEPMLFFSFTGYPTTDPEYPVYANKYIQQGIVYAGQVYWSEKRTAYGTTHPYFLVQNPATQQVLGYCYGFARPVETREHIKEVFTEIETEGV